MLFVFVFVSVSVLPGALSDGLGWVRTRQVTKWRPTKGLWPGGSRSALKCQKK